MKKSRVLNVVRSTIISSLLLTPATVLAVLIDDGGINSINSEITDGLIIQNATSVDINTGANISNSGGTGIWHISGELNINDGLIQDGVTSLSGAPATYLNISGGNIQGGLGIYHHYTTTISGGDISSIFSEAGAHLDISGGTFGGIGTISGSYDITGGVFTSGIYIQNLSEPLFLVKGGSFYSGFSYDRSYATPGSQQTVNFKFFGNVSLEVPSLITGSTYETVISGSLLDGASILQTITCKEQIGDVPCAGVAIGSVIPIDIKPSKKTAVNIIDLKKDKNLKVAIAGSVDFDALQVDPDTVKFGPDLATPLRYKGRDINKDGFSDLLLTFKLVETGITCGDESAILSAQTFPSPVSDIAGIDYFTVESCQ